MEAESILTRLLSLNKSESLDDFRVLARNIFNLIVTFTDKSRQKKYSEHLLRYTQQVLGKKIDPEKAKEIIEDIEQGGDIFFVTLEHLFEDDKKALEEAQKGREKERKVFEIFALKIKDKDDFIDEVKEIVNKGRFTHIVWSDLEYSKKEIRKKSKKIKKN